MSQSCKQKKTQDRTRRANVRSGSTGATRAKRTAPDETWSTVALTKYAAVALAAADKHAEEAAICIGRYIRQRFRAGHAYSILRSRHKDTQSWVDFQAKHNLPRTTVWEAISVYGRAAAAGHGEDEVAACETWTQAMVVYGVRAEKEHEQNDAEADSKDRPGRNQQPASDITREFPVFSDIS